MIEKNMLEFLLPHRPPFLMVDQIIEYNGGKDPSLCADRTLRSDEPVFAHGQFQNNWPSVYLIEGVAQCCILLNAFRNTELCYKDDKRQFEDWKDLWILTDNFKMGVDEKKHLDLHDQQIIAATKRTGLLTMADVIVEGTASVGDTINYCVRQTFSYQKQSKFEVTAYVCDKSILTGIILGAESIKLNFLK